MPELHRVFNMPEQFLDMLDYVCMCLNLSEWNRFAFAHCNYLFQGTIGHIEFFFYGSLMYLILFIVLD